MAEAGVELVPAYPSSLKVPPGISRVWATLWAWAGGKLRRVIADTAGRLIVRPLVFEAAEVVTATENYTVGTPIVIDLGGVYDWMNIQEVGTIANIQLSLNGTDYFGGFFPCCQGTVEATTYWGMELRIRARFLKVGAVGGVGEGGVIVNAARFGG